jgi:hypothetical protein
MSDGFQVIGEVAEAAFTLKIHRGEGMALLAMNWKAGMPAANFVGFGIEYREPGGTAFFPLKNRLNFDGEAGSTSSAKRPPTFSTLVAPIQKFRWVHFPRNADLTGDFLYRVTPVFMIGSGDLSSKFTPTEDGRKAVDFRWVRSTIGPLRAMVRCAGSACQQATPLLQYWHNSKVVSDIFYKIILRVKVQCVWSHLQRIEPNIESVIHRRRIYPCRDVS